MILVVFPVSGCLAVSRTVYTLGMMETVRITYTTQKLNACLLQCFTPSMSSTFFS